MKFIRADNLGFHALIFAQLDVLIPLLLFMVNSWVNFTHTMAIFNRTELRVNIKHSAIND